MMTFEPQALNLGDEPTPIPPEILKAAATVARAELEGMLLYTPRFEALAEAILRAAFSAAAVAQAGPRAESLHSMINHVKGIVTIRGAA